MPEPKPTDPGAAALPFVIDGTYADEEWRRLAANADLRKTQALKDRYAAGPQRHPYTKAAFCDEQLQPDGTLVKRWFPSQPDRDKYVALNEPAKPQMAEPSATNPAPLQAKLEKSAIAATEKARSPTG